MAKSLFTPRVDHLDDLLPFKLSIVSAVVGSVYCMTAFTRTELCLLAPSWPLGHQT